MLRSLSITVALAALAALPLGSMFACGDKINPLGNHPTGTGGSGGPPGGGIDGGQVSEAGNPTGPVSFTNDIAPLLKKGCLCHVQGGVDPLLDTYTNVRANANAALQSVLAGDMPPAGPLSSADTGLLQSWINAGTPNN